LSLSPIDVILYFKALSRRKWIKDNRDNFVSILSSPAMMQSLVRYWIEWFFAGNETLLKNPKIKKFIGQSEFVENQAYAALTSKNVAWVRDNKNRVFYVGEKGKRAILRATKILPKDERDNWLRNIEKNTPEELDRWLIRWAIDTA